MNILKSLLLSASFTGLFSPHYLYAQHIEAEHCNAHHGANHHEHASVMDLVKDEYMTHTAIQSGIWSAPNTW